MGGCVSRKPHVVRHRRILLGRGQASDWSCRRGRQERTHRQRWKCQNCKVCLVMQRVRAPVRPRPLGPCHPSSVPLSTSLPPPLSLCVIFSHFPGPLPLSLFLCPAPCPSLFSRPLFLFCSTCPFWFLAVPLSSSLPLCFFLPLSLPCSPLLLLSSLTLCPDLHRALIFTVSLACSLSFVSLCLYVSLCVLICLPHPPHPSASLSFSLSLCPAHPCLFSFPMPLSLSFFLPISYLSVPLCCSLTLWGFSPSSTSLQGS